MVHFLYRHTEEYPSQRLLLDSLIEDNTAAAKAAATVKGVTAANTNDDVVGSDKPSESPDTTMWIEEDEAPRDGNF